MNTQLTLIQRLLEAQIDTHFATAAAAAVASAAYTTFTVTGATGVDANAENIPSRDVRLINLEGIIDTIAGGATQIIWYISRDAAGTAHLTPQITTNMDPNLAVALGAAGGVSVLLDLPYRATAQSVANNLYVQAHTNVGTCNLRPILSFVTKTPLPIPE